MKIIIAGAGRIGSGIAQSLEAEGHDITVIDRDAATIESVSNSLDVICMLGSATNPDTLRESGAAGADILMAMTESDEVNMICALAAKRLGAKNIIARVRNPEYLSQTEFLRDAIGLSMLVNPEYECAKEISRILRFPGAVRVDTFSKGSAEIIDCRIPEGSPLHGLSLRESAQRQKDFTASFAHELKTPLTSVIGYADTLRSRALPPERQFEAANYIFTEGKRLEAMSFALLDLFALDKKEPERTLCRTEDLAKAAAQSAAYMLQQSGVQLETKVQPGSIQAAKELFVSLLFNLIDNARKASEPGQRITLSGEAVENGYCFRVRDRGRGIPPEALARITEPFYMVDKSRSRAQGGAGLGLTLCQRIAALHGAQLEIESREGQGTTVTIELKGDQA